MDFFESSIEIIIQFVFLITPLIILCIPENYLVKIFSFLMNKNGLDKNCRKQNHIFLVMEAHYAARNCYDTPQGIEDCKDFFAQNPSLVNEAILPYGYTPFHRACLNGCTDLISFMLNIGANVNILSINGDTPIYLTTHAIVTRKIKTFAPLKILINAGCDINHKRHNGYTPIHLAVYFGRTDLVQWFLRNGADPSPYERNIYRSIIY